MKAALNWKPHEKISLSISKHRSINKVNKDLAEIVLRDGETLAQDRDKWKQVCVKVMDLSDIWKPK